MTQEPRATTEATTRGGRIDMVQARATRGGWQRVLSLAGMLIALTMLAAFYSVVASAMQRSASGREQARAEVERQVVCSAFSSASSRDLCVSTLAARSASEAIITPAAYKVPVQPATTVSSSSYD